MGLISRIFIRARELRSGQTMTEYALILAAVAVVVYVTYQILGQDINVLVTRIDTQLSGS